jgi:endonuclease/exonuclease/phosphatase family metal-dependent hydrolase
LNEVDFDSFRSGRFNQAEFIAVEAGFPFWAEQRNIDMSLPFAKIRYGNAVLSRYPVTAADRVPYKGHNLLENILMGKKEGLVCTVELPDARSIRVLAVHLDHRREATRMRSAKAIEETRLASPLPLIAAGDFNSAPVGFPHAAPDENGDTAVSWLLSQGAFKTSAGNPPEKDHLTFSSRQPFTAIDWILVPSDWEIVSKAVVNRPLSDHIAVIVEVRI